MAENPLSQITHCNRMLKYNIVMDTLSGIINVNFPTF
jgi:hypothetical protein